MISQRGVHQPQRGGANIPFAQFFLKTAWKWKKFGQEGGRVPCAPPLDPPLFKLSRAVMTTLELLPIYGFVCERCFFLYY